MTADGVAAVPFTVSADRSGVHTYRAAAHSQRDDLDTAIDQAGVVVVASGVSRILHVGDGPLALAAALENDSFQVSRAPGGSLPASAAALARYDGVILDDVSPDALNDNQVAALHTYVESMGGGLLVLGSPRSLEPGLSPDSPMGRLLPIDLRPRSGGRAPGVALVVVFDKSGSMDDRVNGAPRIEFAREAIAVEPSG